MFPRAGPETLELMHAVIRKTAHLANYFILGLLLNRALRGEDRAWELKWAIWAVIIAAIYASLDEFHQSFVPTRTAHVSDVVIDTIGAAVGIFALWLIGRWRRNW